MARTPSLTPNGGPVAELEGVSALPGIPRHDRRRVIEHQLASERTPGASVNASPASTIAAGLPVR